MKLGTFTRADGKTYQVADWVDTSSASTGSTGTTAMNTTLYFDRTADGRLRLATIQNNA